MGKLELKHLAPYLPYGLKMYSENLKGDNVYQWKLKPEHIEDALAFQNKPILRPLSDLTKDSHSIKLFELCGNIDENLDYLCEFNGDLTNTSLSFRATQYLFLYHFDVFGLIPEGLAIDINTLKQ